MMCKVTNNTEPVENWSAEINSFLEGRYEATPYELSDISLAVYTFHYY
jgi:hypothetical protein